MRPFKQIGSFSHTRSTDSNEDLISLMTSVVVGKPEAELYIWLGIYKLGTVDSTQRDPAGLVVHYTWNVVQGTSGNMFDSNLGFALYPRTEI
jgi:hypothetical protein